MIAFRNEPMTETRWIDLNADLGEGFPNDRALLELVSSASVCCGAHAGSPEVIRQTLRDAKDLGVVVGAHPGYRDREGFGRREQSLTIQQLFDLVKAQLDLLTELAGEADVNVAFLKPHGALYNQAQREQDAARPLALAALMFELPLVGQPGSALETRAHFQHVPFVAEGFPDRRYRPDGSLVPRSEPDAILRDPLEIKAQVLRLLGERKFATICIHGDDPRAVTNALLVRGVLEEVGFELRPFVVGSA